MTVEERDRLAERMAYVGSRNREDFIRQAVLYGYNVKVDSSELREYIRLIGSISHNINQIVRRANETRSIYESDVNDLRIMCEDVLELARDSLKAQQDKVEKIKEILGELVDA